MLFYRMDKRRIFHEIWQQTISIVSADGTENAGNGIVHKSLFQIGRPRLRMVFQICNAFQRIFHEYRFQPVFPETLDTDFQIMAAEFLSEYALRQTDNSYPVAFS